jgi:hypothetical protein
MDLEVPGHESVRIDPVLIQKMGFIFNALEEGWTIKKKKNLYIFTKNHEGKREVHLDSYLRKFLLQNFDINKILG